jgi:hypothetical protein
MSSLLNQPAQHQSLQDSPWPLPPLHWLAVGEVEAELAEGVLVEQGDDSA